MGLVWRWPSLGLMATPVPVLGRKLRAEGHHSAPGLPWLCYGPASCFTFTKLKAGIRVESARYMPETKIMSGFLEISLRFLWAVLEVGDRIGIGTGFGARQI